MLFRTPSFYTPELLRAHPDFTFVFGDNLERYGKGGQAAIRDEPNALGLATKRAPSNEPDAFFDDEDHFDFAAMMMDVAVVLRTAVDHHVVIPFSHRVELGTGLSQLPEKAPSFYEVLSDIFDVDIPEIVFNG